MKYKKYIFILILSIGIYMVLTFLYTKFIKDDNYITAYVTIASVNKGDIVSLDNIKPVKIENMVSDNMVLREDDFKNKVFKYDITQGELLKKNELMDNSEYIPDDIEYEYISLRLNGSEPSVSYKVKKDSKINIYYTAKTSQISDFISFFNNELDKILTLGAVDSYTTISFINNVKVIDAINKNGISTSNQNVESVDNLVDTIIVKVEKDVAMKINNLKNYGTFSCTINE